MLDYTSYPIEPTTHTDSGPVDARLSQLHPSLTQEILLDANRIGYTSRLEATPAHATTTAGTMHWHSCVGSLRASLAALGWSIVNHKNCPFVLSPDGKIAIVVMTGSEETGALHEIPTNRAEKGAVIGAAVLRNAQLHLFRNDDERASCTPMSSTQVWVYLYHAEQSVHGVREIRSELSLPSDFKGRKIVGWSERIILNSIDPNNERISIAPLPSRPIEIQVERK